MCVCVCVSLSVSVFVCVCVCCEFSRLLHGSNSGLPLISLFSNTCVVNAFVENVMHSCKLLRDETIFHLVFIEFLLSRSSCSQDVRTISQVPACFQTPVYRWRSQCSHIRRVPKACPVSIALSAPCWFLAPLGLRPPSCRRLRISS